MTELPIVEPPDRPDFGRPERIAGVLLAAGTSSRYGPTNKLLASIDGDPIVRHAGRSLAAADLDRLVAVVGHDADAVADALDGLGFTIVENPGYEAGQSTSVRAGVRALADETAAVVVALGDMPFVEPATVDALVAAYRDGAGTALAAAHEGERGNPVLFDSRHFDALTDVSGDVGGRHILLHGDDSALVKTGDSGVTWDIDTPDDLRDERSG